ncbi:sensor histidine kinase [Desertibacillus haloalkaliphilus]|uniref:sensor histidine kinase n=1 Tax=Desertibacillus haloalkaliphilus TaxID=1328930 RepID=UPI001C280E47|nr:ATP-binding protein [Desertibacillus haloalkaliphilus]MBU8907936.1 HAMP domain-containing protein [Desertibacillus haloalkaliphilus]
MENILKRMSFRNKILIAMLLVVSLLSGGSLLFVHSFSQVNDVNQFNKEKVQELLWLNEWQKELALKRYQLERFLETDSESVIDDFDYRVISDIADEVPAALVEVNKDLDMINFVYENKVKGLLIYSSNDAAKQVIEEELLPMITSAKAQLDQLQGEAYTSLTEQSSEIREIIVTTLWILLMITSFATFLSIYLSYKISLGISKPTEKLVDKVSAISEGDYGLTIDKHPQYEFKKLTVAINQMSIRLRESFDTLYKEKLLREQILASIPIGIITLYNQGHQIEINSQARKLTGVTSKELEHLVKGSIRLDKNKELWELFRSGEFFDTKKIQIDSSGKESKVLVSQSPLFNEKAEIVGRIFYFLDVSSADALEKRIHRSEKLALAGEVAASSAHEIRNPLAVIHGFLTIMNQTVDEHERDQYQLPLILKEIDRINYIIEDMLMLAKPGTPKKNDYYIHTVLDEILPIIHSSCPVDISIDVSLERLLVHIDFNQMKQVFHNLLRNSIQALGEEGTISITSKQENGQALIYIADDGPGIPEEMKAQIFEPFITNKDDGTGLGLTIIRRVLESHEGSIHLVYSGRKGTVFELMLPLVDQAQ